MAKVAIQPRILKGFRDLLPEQAIPRNRMVRRLAEVFESFGFAPIDTPALEYAEILLGKGSDETDKQMYRFEDNGGRDVALRFDLTVPLARFAAMHINELGAPFRRYHIAPVWRAEKPQRGRYREFYQCDFDIIGTRSAVSDAEILTLIHSAFRKLGVDHKIRFNNRLLLNALLRSLGAEDKATEVLRGIDKLEKIGKDGVREELERTASLSASALEQIFSFISLSSGENSSNATTVNNLREFFRDSELAADALRQTEAILEIAAASGVDDRHLSLDLSIARGLDYYTGAVFETSIPQLPDIGSVCSGGRYDNLAGLYTKQDLPGVGASIGLDRLLAALTELEKLEKVSSTAKVLVVLLEEAAPTCAALAERFRKADVPTELYPAPAAFGKQFKYADRKGIAHVVIQNQEQASREVCSIKQMGSGEQLDDISFDEALSVLRNK